MNFSTRPENFRNTDFTEIHDLPDFLKIFPFNRGDYSTKRIIENQVFQ